jgi:hypothetical protein
MKRFAIAAMTLVLAAAAAAAALGRTGVHGAKDTHPARPSGLRLGGAVARLLLGHALLPGRGSAGR